jgi:hypothetical protein
VISLPCEHFEQDFLAHLGLLLNTRKETHCDTHRQKR